MELNQQDSQLIDRYLQNDLSDTEAMTVEKRLTAEPVLAEAVTFRQLIQKGGQMYGRENLKKMLVEADKEMDGTVVKKAKNPSNSPVLPLWRWGIAAAIASIIAVGLWWYVSNPSGEQLFAEHYQPMTNLIAPIDKSKPAEEPLNLALQAYERGDFTTALAQFENLDNIPLDSRIYYGLTLLNSGNVVKAQQELAALAANSQARFQEAAQWYLVLAYIKEEHFDDAKAALQPILTNQQHRYWKMAVALDKDWKN